MKRNKLRNRLVSALLTLAMLISCLLQTSVTMAKTENSRLYLGEGYQVVFAITSRWTEINPSSANKNERNTGNLGSCKNQPEGL